MRDPYLTRSSIRLSAPVIPCSYRWFSTPAPSSPGGVRRSQHFGDLTRRAADAITQKVSPPKDDYQRSLLSQIEQVQAAVDVGHAEDARVAAADHITLSDVKMISSSGDGLELPSVRLSLDAIAGWWLTPGKPIKGTKDASGFLAVGFTFEHPPRRASRRGG